MSLLQWEEIIGGKGRDREISLGTTKRFRCEIETFEGGGEWER